MQVRPSHPIRAHAGASLVVLGVLLAIVLSLARPVDAAVAPVDPVPVGVWPLVPTHEVVRGFDPPDDPWGAGHRGVDLLGRVGQPVRSALAGRVTYAGPLAGRGVVVVDHGDTRTTYEPVSPAVHRGDRVARGGRIGILELTGSHCLPRACLHWGWIRGTTYLDPLLLVGAGPVRLLPLKSPDPSTRAPTWRPPESPYAALVAVLLEARHRLRRPVRPGQGGFLPRPGRARSRSFARQPLLP